MPVRTGVEPIIFRTATTDVDECQRFINSAVENVFVVVSFVRSSLAGVLGAAAVLQTATGRRSRMVMAMAVSAAAIGKASRGPPTRSVPGRMVVASESGEYVIDVGASGCELM